MTHPDGPAPFDPTSGYVQESRDRWTFRRILMFAASGWMATVISYLAVFGQSDNVIQSYLAQSLPLAFVGLVVSYVIGPIADDWLQLRWNRASA